VLRCPKYAHERWALLKHTQDENASLTDILANPNIILPLASHVEATGRLEVEPLQMEQQAE
jgi:hypothetical protein